MTEDLKISADLLTLKIDLSNVVTDFQPLDGQAIIGQQRAQSAFRFGVTMQGSGYNIYVMGDSGSGRLSMINAHLGNLVSESQTPPDYLYAVNFENSREPVAVQLPAGQGRVFANDIEHLIDNVLAVFPEAFENPAYQQKKAAIERLFNQRYNSAIDQVEKKAIEQSIALFRDEGNISFAPARDQRPLDEDQFSRLTQQERDEFHDSVEKLEEFLAEVLLELPQWRRNRHERLSKLDRDTVEIELNPLFADILRKYQQIDGAGCYLEALQKHLPGTILDSLGPEQPVETLDNKSKRKLLARQYVPNMLIQRQSGTGAPIVYEPHPTYQNLFGRIECASEQGSLVTRDWNIRAGALHRANGGYLILDAEKIISFPQVWDGLKRALKAGKIEIETPAVPDAASYGFILKPDVIQLDVKIVLLGTSETYYLMHILDSEFDELFRILADFDDHIPIDKDTLQQFSAMMIRHAQFAVNKKLSSQALLHLIQHSCRQAENQMHFSAKIRNSLEIIDEASEFMRQSVDTEIDARHIEQALAAREQRCGKIAREILDDMLDGTILIDTERTSIGKVNGLTVIEEGESSFGAPVRITATVYPGSRGIVDIEREVELGQSIHSKGVLILTGYLGHHYAQHFPLAVSASIAIEQSYGHIDGDSASLAELCALISALIAMPVRQDMAITGSINQYGEIQAVGGINEKIEGYFDLCHARGLTGEQGVIIPQVNQRNLILKQAVIHAVEKGAFAIYAVSHVDEALELLASCSAGRKDAQGQFPPDSINGRIIARLKEISELSSDKEDAHEG